ncbi:MAG: hypothetical protein KIT44_09235 [Opitutaceae bacterium]|nr:hypothetical protein [Opitutaceae bacterium]
MIARPLLFALATALFAGASGCTHYRLGTGAAPAFATLHVAPVEARALIPQAQPVVSSMLREAFLRDGRVQLVHATEADAVLTVVLTGYDREVATVRPGDTGLARKFDVTLSAEATLRDNRTGTDLFVRRPLTAKRQLFTDSGQVQAEYQLLPLLAEDLAEKARRAALDVW